MSEHRVQAPAPLVLMLSPTHARQLLPIVEYVPAAQAMQVLPLLLVPAGHTALICKLSQQLAFNTDVLSLH